ncbi:uncharacterized protein G2W53_018178 [Senna tora]|uniref:DUF659 domain-containing protein n=1 Tax=Senna tora TaxID=362788 RepID=A0A834WRG4_9FABA|nr:uncharacterized protein G2W53_018178 [Senna tora]
MGRQAKILATNRREKNVYEEGGGSNARDINLVQSRSTKQLKIIGGLMKTLRKKLGEAISKLIIYERLPMNLASLSWLHNLINAAAEIDNEGALKAAGKKLMKKRKHVYWTPCAAHCINLCLEDIGKKSNVKNVLKNASDARRGSSQSGRGHFQQFNMIDDSSSSSCSHSDSTYGIGESSQSSQGYPSTISTFISNKLSRPISSPIIEFSLSSTNGAKRWRIFLYYVFGEGYGGDNNQSESGEGYDPPRHSTMW